MKTYIVQYRVNGVEYIQARSKEQAKAIFSCRSGIDEREVKKIKVIK